MNIKDVEVEIFSNPHGDRQSMIGKASLVLYGDIGEIRIVGIKILRVTPWDTGKEKITIGMPNVRNTAKCQWCGKQVILTANFCQDCGQSVKFDMQNIYKSKLQNKTHADVVYPRNDTTRLNIEGAVLEEYYRKLKQEGK